MRKLKECAQDLFSVVQIPFSWASINLGERSHLPNEDFQSSQTEDYNNGTIPSRLAHDGPITLLKLPGERLKTHRHTCSIATVAQRGS